MSEDNLESPTEAAFEKMQKNEAEESEKFEQVLYQDYAALDIDIEKIKLSYIPADPDINTLYQNYKDGDLKLDPDFQRHYVWDPRKASNLIESILLKYPIPPIFTYEEGETEEVVDGQQRLTSIFCFIDGKFPDGSIFKLRKLKMLNKLKGKTYKDLDEKLQKAIKKRTLSFIRLQESSQENIKFEMFERLNTNITKLNAQELRNCLYRGSYNNLIKNLAQDADFQHILNQPDYQKRMLDSELVLLFLAFYHKNYDQFKGNVKELLTDDMAKYSKIEGKDIREIEDVFKKSVDLIKYIFSEDAFRIFSVNEKTKMCTFESRELNQGLYLVLMYGFIPYSKNQIMPYADLIKEELINLEVHDDTFRDSLIGSGTNSKEKITKKLDIWRETMKGVLGYPVQEPRCFSFKLKESLWKTDPTCKLCNQHINSVTDAEVDHITCYWKGGRTIPENARLTHRVCNRMRGGDSQKQSESYIALS